MTRKDYVAIAAELKRERFEVEAAMQTEAVNAIDRVAIGLCGLMSMDNPRFDRARFLKACGIQE